MHMGPDRLELIYISLIGNISNVLFISMIFRCLCCCYSSEIHQQNEYFFYKFRQANSNFSKRVFEAAKLILIKERRILLTRNLGLATFGELLIVFSVKINLLDLLFLTRVRCCVLQMIKQSCLLKY